MQSGSRLDTLSQINNNNNNDPNNISTHAQPWCYSQISLDHSAQLSLCKGHHSLLSRSRDTARDRSNQPHRSCEGVYGGIERGDFTTSILHHAAEERICPPFPVTLECFSWIQPFTVTVDPADMCTSLTTFNCLTGFICYGKISLHIHQMSFHSRYIFCGQMCTERFLNPTTTGCFCVGIHQPPSEWIRFSDRPQKLLKQKPFLSRFI